MGVLKAKVAGNWVEIPQTPTPPPFVMYQAFATIASRDALWPSPPEGAQAWIINDKAMWIRQGGAWISPWPRGVLDYGQVLSNLGPDPGTGTGGTTLEGGNLRVDFVLTSTRRVRLTGSLRTITSSVAGDVFNFNIKRVSDNVVGNAAQLGPANPSAGISCPPVIWEPLLVAGTYAYVLALQRVVGTGNFTAYGSSVAPIWMSAVDIGEI